MTDIWRETAVVRFGSVDRSDRLTLGSICGFFQEAAISHAANLGVGRYALARNGRGWILSRLSLFVERRPACGETIEISTWPRGAEKLFALRDYEIRDAAGVSVVRGRGAWLVLDIEKRRPLRPQSVMDGMPLNDGIDAFPDGAIGLDPGKNLLKNSERVALYSDIDYYGHANNARYIQWIQDATNIGILTEADRMRLDINYLSEILPGETVEIWTASFKETGQSFACAYEGRRPNGKIGGSGHAAFRAELRINHVA